MMWLQGLGHYFAFNKIQEAGINDCVEQEIYFHKKQ